jgi:hypothetical protein
MSKQLELFEVLSDRQLQTIKEYKDSRLKEQIKRRKDIDVTVRLMNEAGFKEGIDYKNNFKTRFETKIATLGAYTRPYEAFESEVTSATFGGGVYIIHKQYNSGKMEVVEQLSSVRLDGNKLECGFTPQYRSYLPKSLYKKMIESNTEVDNKFERDNVEAQVLAYTIKKYQKLYPKAQMSTSREYKSGYHGGHGYEFDIIRIVFTSGSNVTLRLGYHKDAEYIYKSHDVVLANKTLEGKLDHFNNQ